MASILEKVIREVIKRSSVIENVIREMDHFLPPNAESGWDRGKFRGRVGQSLDNLPLSVSLGIGLPSYLLRYKSFFEFAHELESTDVAQVLSASRMPLALRVDDVPRIEKEGPLRGAPPPSLFDKEHYSEKATRGLTDQKYDVVVIGSGPGGSEAAVAMLRKDPSLRLLLIEAGKEYTSEQLGRMTQSEPFTHLYTQGGIQFAVGEGMDTFPLLTAKAAGGTARINSGTYEDVHGEHREGVIDRHFRGDERRFERINGRAKFDYFVSEVPRKVVNSTQQNYFELAKTLGYNVRMLNSARSWKGKDACTGRAACYLGCLAGAKKSPDNVGLVEILDNENAFVLGDTKAVKIRTKRGKATSVDVINQGRKYEVGLARNGVVVVAGGAVGTAKLLLESGIQAGDRFLCHTQTEVYRRSPEPVYADRGLPQGIMTPLNCGGTAECAHPSAGVLALLATNMYGEDLRRYTEEYSHIEVLGAIVEDEPLLGRVEKSIRGINIRYQHSERDQRLIRETAAEMLEIWAHQEGNYFLRTNVYPRFSSGEKKYSEMERRGWVHRKHFERYRDHLRNLDNLFPTSSVHLFATAFDSIVDHTTGQIKGLDNVYVTDASGLLQTRVNPQGTIYAVAHAKGENILDRR